jgi:hypothetical protein
MIEPRFCGRLSVVLGLVLSGSAALHAQEAKVEHCFEELVQRSWCELEQIYRQAKPGCAPLGFLRGQVVYCPDEPLAHARGRMTTLLWHGKHFGCDGTLVNQWSGARAIRARVDYGPSWLDGQPSIILDYSGTSHIWHDVRDEMREIAPGLYLGAMYRGQCPCAKLKLFFVLQAPCCCGK